MQIVSQKWIDTHRKTITDESFVEVSIDIADPDSLADVSAEDNGAIYFSDSSRIVSEVDKDIVPYATLEENIWLLDGNRKTVPTSNYGDNGFISSSISDENGYFTTKPTITLNFTKVHENIIPGITITWGIGYDEYPTSFTITAHNGDVKVAEKTVTDNATVESLIFVDIDNYDKIVIEVNKWCLPYHRARISDVFVGISKVYGKADLFSYRHNQSVDPLSTTLPKMEISFAISNVDDSYNPYNTSGVSKYLIERQEVKTRYGYKVGENEVEWIKGGTFYLSSWEAPQNGMKAEFKARDLLEFMSTIFYEGVYGENGTSLYDLAEQVLIKADLPLNNDGSVKWIIDESLKSIYSTSPLPVDTCANCLQLIANAGECVIYPDRNGILHIERISNEVSDYEINYSNSYSKPEMSLSKPLKQVEVTLYQHSVGESTELYKGVTTVNGTDDVVVIYSNPAENVKVTVTGGTLNSFTNYKTACVLNITASGEVNIVVTGNEIVTNTTVVTIPHSKQGEVVTVDNPLVTSTDRALSVGEWVRNYMQNRTALSSSWRADPRIDALDIVANRNSYGTNNERICEVEFEYSGAFKGTCEGKVI